MKYNVYSDDRLLVNFITHTFHITTINFKTELKLLEEFCFLTFANDIEHEPTQKFCHSQLHQFKNKMGRNMKCETLKRY
jgi:hypothetical protein